MALLKRNSISYSSSGKPNKPRKGNHSQKTSAGNSSFIESRLGLEEDIATVKAKIALYQERRAVEKRSRDMLEEIERQNMDVLKQEERRSDKIRNVRSRYKVKEELAQKHELAYNSEVATN